MKHSLTLLLASTSLAIAADPVGVSVFEEKVRPLLEKHCVECHGAKKQKG